MYTIVEQSISYIFVNSCRYADTRAIISASTSRKSSKSWYEKQKYHNKTLHVIGHIPIMPGTLQNVDIEL